MSGTDDKRLHRVYCAMKLNLPRRTNNRQVLAIEVAHSIPSLRVIRVMEQLIEMHGKPKAGAWTTGRSSLRSPSPSGVRAAASKRALSNPGNQTRTQCRP